MVRALSFYTENTKFGHKKLSAGRLLLQLDNLAGGLVSGATIGVTKRLHVLQRKAAQLR
jgi:hypothetical protein